MRKLFFIISILLSILALTFISSCSSDSNSDNPSAIPDESIPTTDTSTVSLSTPKIAFDGSGNAIMVWHQWDGTYDPDLTPYHLVASTFNPATGWVSPQIIYSAGATSLQLAVNTFGNAIVVWSQRYESEFVAKNIWAITYNPATGWGAPENIESSTPSAEDPQIAIDTSGNAIAVWQQDDAEIDSIWANTYNPITGWGAPETIESSASSAYNPQIAFDISGNAIAVWQQGGIYANTYNPATGWGTPEAIGSGFDPKIAFDTSGNAIAVWSRSSSDGLGIIWANTYNPISGWGEPEAITSNVSHQYEMHATPAFEPEIAVDSLGNAIAVWSQWNETYTSKSIWVNKYTFDLGWGTPEIIELEMGESREQQIAFGPLGNAIVVWVKSDDTHTLHNNFTSYTKTLANSYSPDTGWETAVTIGSTLLNSKKPQIAFSPLGYAIAVWAQINRSPTSSTDFPYYSIWINQYYNQYLGWGIPEKFAP